MVLSSGIVLYILYQIVARFSGVSGRGRKTGRRGHAGNGLQGLSGTAIRHSNPAPGPSPKHQGGEQICPDSVYLYRNLIGMRPLGNIFPLMLRGDRGGLNDEERDFRRIGQALHISARIKAIGQSNARCGEAGNILGWGGAKASRHGLIEPEEKRLPEGKRFFQSCRSRASCRTARSNSNCHLACSTYRPGCRSHHHNSGPRRRCLIGYPRLMRQTCCSHRRRCRRRRRRCWTGSPVKSGSWRAGAPANTRSHSPRPCRHNG